MRLFKYVTIEVLRIILRQGTIRLTQPSAFNDPFEMVPELYVPQCLRGRSVTHQFDILAPRRVTGIGKVDDTVDPDQCSDEISRRIRKELDRGIGILCLSKNPASSLMWAHYANSYSGAMIEFDGNHEFFTGAFDIEYTEKRPRRHVRAYLNGPVPIAELCDKSIEWKYESEVRVVRKLTDCKKVSDDEPFPIYVMRVPQECIRGITVGERTDIEDQRFVFASVRNTKIALNLAAVANWDYEFRLEPIKLDVPVSEFGPMKSARTAHIFSGLPGNLGEGARWMIANHRLTEVVNDIL